MRYVLALALLLSIVPAAWAITSAEYCAEPAEVEFLSLLNQYRAANGAGPVVMDQYLGTAAEHHTMLESEYNMLFHDYPEIGFSWGLNIRDHGWRNGGWLAEISTGSYADAADVLGNFQGSPSHNEAMLDPKYQAVGISRYDDGGLTQARYWWVIEFSSSPIMEPSVICGQPTLTPSNTPPPAFTPTPKKCPTKNPHYPNC